MAPPAPTDFWYTLEGGPLDGEKVSVGYVGTHVEIPYVVPQPDGGASDDPYLPSQIVVLRYAFDGQTGRLRYDRARKPARFEEVPGDPDIHPPPPYWETVRALERKLIYDALNYTDWDVKKAAAFLRLPRKTMYRKMARYWITRRGQEAEDDR